MLLLQVIHGLAHGEHAGSSRDAKQLARFAAVIRDMTHAADTGCGPKWAGEKVTLDAGDVALVRKRIRKYLPRAAKLTYEERERLIAEIDLKSSVVRMVRRFKKQNREAQAETLRVQAVCEANEKRREATRKRLRDKERQIREEYQSGEFFRKSRKRAKEGDAKAVAMFEDVGLRVADLAD